MNRREFLATASGAAVGLALPRPAGADPIPRPAAEPLAGLDARGARILALAALAPSSHNVQPWAVEVAAPGRWRVGLDPARRLPEVDPSGREMVLSVGCFLENLVQAAAGEGLRAEVEPDAGPDPGALVAVRLAPARAGADARAADRIRTRRTVRNGHLSRPLSPEHLRALLEAAGPATAFFPAGSPEASRLAEATVEAMRVQTRRDAAQRELASWIRFREEDVRRRADGLTVAGMEAGGLAGFFMRHFMDADAVMKAGFREKGIEICARQVKEGAGFLVIASRETGSEAVLDAGRRFERMALLVRDLGIGAHPMSQALEEAPWRDALARDPGVEGVVQLVVRLGYVERTPPPVSPRRPLEAFVRA